MLEALNVQWNAAQLAVLTKALLAHGALGHEAADALRLSLELGDDFRDHIARYLGYGVVPASNVFWAARIIASPLSRPPRSRMAKDTFTSSLCLRVYPASSGCVALRVTLAWFTPINPLHRDYRRAGLWVSTPESALNVRDRSDADMGRLCNVGRCNMRFSRETRRWPYVDGAAIRLKVNCRADAGRLDDRIPYALAVTLEAEQDLRVPVYQEVAERINLQTEVRVI